MASFGLEQDVGLQRLGKLVHTLDVGGTNPEAAGFALLLKGLKHRPSDDDTLLLEGGQILDDFYNAYALRRMYLERNTTITPRHKPQRWGRLLNTG